ncbi:MAG: baseplate J/gp47 family protein [Desulfobacterales bacterium]|nr:baseplate J/gp47 family protein [Desulfobacterales bacterium]
MSIPIDKDIDDIRQETYDFVESVQEEYAEKGWLPTRLNLEKGLLRGLIEIWIWALNQVYFLLITILKQIDIDNASGLWLELICKNVQVEKKAKTKAIGKVVFNRSETTGNCVIKKDRIVKTKPDGNGLVFRFVSTEEVVISEGMSEIEVPVEAEEYGQNSNVVAGQIAELVTPVDGIDSITNVSDWLTKEGTDEESDDSLRERYKLAWKGSDGCTKYAYEKWAFEVTGVKSVLIEDQHPRGQGTIDIILLGTAGLPSQSLIDEVNAVIDEKNPINDDILVKSPEQIIVDVVAEIEGTSGTSLDFVSQGENIISGMFPLNIGEDLTLDRITSALMAIKNSKKINITSPVTDIEADNQSMVVINSYSISAKIVEA